ncbi:MAG: sugar transferase [Gammaproteobacteria bacterium]
MTLYERRIKRLADVMLALLVLILLSPLLLLTALAIRIEDGGPTLFRQMRVGRDGKQFRLFKFRSMPVSVPSVPSAQAKSLPITRVGRVVRRTNIDELPQLFNVLRGDMSIVGPRPALPSQAELLTMRAARGVLRLKPGVTGLAQVNAYDGMPESEKVEWDARYASVVSGVRDLTVVLRTIGYIVRRPPVY